MARRPDIKALLQEDLAGDAMGPSPLRTILGKDTPGRFIQIRLESVAPNPHQPRKHLDPAALEELTDSVRQQGVLEPILVYKTAGADGYTLIAGQRRLHAARTAGLSHVPAIICPEERALEISLVENLQREDLNPIDEAEALLMLKDLRGYTDENLAKVVGKSRQSVSESLSLARLPDHIKAECRMPNVRQWTKIQLLQVFRAGSPEKVDAAWQALRGGQVTTVRALREATKTPTKPTGRPKHYTFAYRPEHGRFRVTVTFTRARVTPDELKAALMETLTHRPK